MRRIYLLLCGVPAPLVYVVTVILGGLLRPGYSQNAHAVSELIVAGAPNTSLLIPLFTLYDILLVAFGAGLLLTVKVSPEAAGALLPACGSFCPAV